MDFDGSIMHEFHSAKVTSYGGLIAYRVLDDAPGLFESVSTVFFAIFEQDVISNMICPHSCVNRFTVVLQGNICILIFDNSFFVAIIRNKSGEIITHISMKAKN